MWLHFEIESAFANFLIFYSYPFLLGALNISGGITGIVVGFASCFTMIFRLASGIYMDKIGGQYVMTIVAAVYIASFALLNSPIYQLVILGRILIGISLGMLSTILMFHTIASAQSNAQKGQGIALYTFFSMLPTCLAPYLSLEILHYGGPGTIVVVAITLSFIGLALTFFLESFSAKVGGDGNNSPFTLRDLMVAIRSRDIGIALGSLGLLYTISGATVSFLPAMLESTNQSYAARYFLTFSIAMLVPRLLLKGHMPIGDIFPVKAFLGAAACALCGSMLNYWLLSQPVVLVGAIMNGAALGYIYPAISAYVVCQCADHIKGSMAAITSCFADGGVILANLVLGVSSLYFPGKLILLFPIIFAVAAMALFILAYYFSVTKKILLSNYEFFSMNNTLVFLSDYEAAEEFEAVFNLLRPHGIEGILAKPKDVIVASVNGEQHFFFKGHKLSPTLVIGYTYEDDLLPGMRLLTQFREAGIKVLNDGETLYYGQHKDVSSMRLSASTDIKHMPYMMCSADLVHHIIDAIGFPCVAKPINGACGLGLYKFDDEASFRAWISAPVAAVGVNSGSHRDYYVQPYIEKKDGVDYRIACIGHQAVYAYERRSSNGGWVTNLSSNGLGKIVSLDILGNEALTMAESASRAIGSLFCGVDLAFDIQGQPFIIEANTCPAIKISRYIPGACDGLERAFATYLLDNYLNQKNEEDKQ